MNVNFIGGIKRYKFLEEINRETILKGFTGKEENDKPKYEETPAENDNKIRVNDDIPEAKLQAVIDNIKNFKKDDYDTLFNVYSIAVKNNAHSQVLDAIEKKLKKLSKKFKGPKKGEEFNHKEHGNITFSHKVKGSEDKKSEYHFLKGNSDEKVKLSKGEVKDLKKNNKSKNKNKIITIGNLIFDKQKALHLKDLYHKSDKLIPDMKGEDYDKVMKFFNIDSNFKNT